MIKQNWKIDDSEKFRILNLHESATKNHYLLNEQTKIKVGEKTTNTGKEITLDKKSYPAGFYSIEKLGDGKRDLDNKLQEIAKFAKENDGTTVNIQIEVGESKVTNYDNENPEYVTVKDKKGNDIKIKKKLEDGTLATLRGEKLKEYLTKYFEGLVESGYLTTMPNIPTPQTNVGLGTQKHKYTRDVDDPKDTKYLEDQYVKFNITLSATKTENIYECLVNLVIDVSYYDKPDPKFLCRGKHNCNEAEFEIYLDSVLLGIANLNNAGCRQQIRENPNACDRTAKFTVTDEMVKKITSNPKWNKKTLILSTRCLSSNCHTSVQEVKIVNGDGSEIYHGCVNPQSARGNTSQKILAVLDKCGKPIEGTIEDNVSAEDMQSLSDEVSSSKNKKIDEIINSEGLTPTTSTAINLFSTKNIQLVNTDSDNQNLITTFKFNRPISVGSFINPFGGSKPYKHSFKSGDTGKIKYPLKTVNVSQRRLEKLTEDGLLVKVPNFDGYFVPYPIKINGVEYPINTVLSISKE
jgi:hypothetical protein